MNDKKDILTRVFDKEMFQRWRNRLELTSEVLKRLGYECPKCGEEYPNIRQTDRNEIECSICGFKLNVASKFIDWVIVAFMVGALVGIVLTFWVLKFK